MSKPRRATPSPASSTGGHTSVNAELDVDALAALVAAEVARHLAAAPPPEADLDAKGAAALLALPASWVEKAARENRIPHVRHGKYVRFQRAELVAWRDARIRGPRARTGNGPVSTSRDRP